MHVCIVCMFVYVCDGHVLYVTFPHVIYNFLPSLYLTHLSCSVAGSYTAQEKICHQSTKHTLKLNS